MSEKNETVNQMMDEVKSFLEISKSANASVALFVLSLIACYLGRDNQEETVAFKKAWAELKDVIEPHVGLDEFVTIERFVEVCIVQVLHPDKYPNSLHREKSSLTEKNDFILKFLKT